MRFKKAAAEEIERTVLVRIDKVGLEGNLVIPEGAKGIVLFAHGSGSSRLSPRNRYVAGELNKIPGASHLFEEPGALEKAALLARDRFLTYL